MNHLVKILGCAALLTLLAGCGNDFNKEVERWNRQFAAYKSGCLSGNVESCRLGCEMKEKKSLCERARRFVDPDDPAQVAWLAACPESIAEQGAPLCLRASQAVTAPAGTAPVPAQPEADSPAESAFPGAEAPPSQEIAVGKNSPIPRIRSGAAMVQGSLSKEVIRRIVHRHINEVKFCYERGLASKPDLSGRVAVKFIISGTGAVQTAAVASSTLGDSGVESCIAQATRRWIFPQPQGGGIVIVTYPYQLDTSD